MGKCFYFTWVFFEYTLVVYFYLIGFMQAIVFSTLNFKNAIFTHSYFIVSFIFSLAYFLVFVIGWVYTLYKVL